jgi:hypothetical protein
MPLIHQLDRQFQTNEPLSNRAFVNLFVRHHALCNRVLALRQEMVELAELRSLEQKIASQDRRRQQLALAGVKIQLARSFACSNLIFSCAFSLEAEVW